MQDFILTIINYSAAMSLVILLFLALTPSLSKHYSAKGLYYTWIKITDRGGNTITKYIDIELSNDEFNHTIVAASLSD